MANLLNGNSRVVTFENMEYYLKGYGSILFCFILEYNEETKKTISALSLYKLDISSAKWDELEYLKDWDITNKTWDTIQDDASDLCTTSEMWEKMLDGDYADPKVEDKDDEIVVNKIMYDDDDDDEAEQFTESHPLNLPLHTLEMIMEHCVGLEYLNFHTTCKLCHLAAPAIKWSDKSALRRMHNYSLLSPLWLMEIDRKQCLYTFTDPMSGDKFFLNTSDILSYPEIIRCSRFGWLLFYTGFTLTFYSPFTSDQRELPFLGYAKGSFWEPSWRKIAAYSHTFRSATFLGQDLFALCNEGELHACPENLLRQRVGINREKKLQNSFSSKLPTGSLIFICSTPILQAGSFWRNSCLKRPFFDPKPLPAAALSGLILVFWGSSFLNGGRGRASGFPKYFSVDPSESK
ncbi:hypothetical protein Tco_0719860 [Tanacetum coccineum]